MKTYTVVFLIAASMIAASVLSACSAVQAQGAQPTVQDVLEPQARGGEAIETVVPEGKNQAEGVVVIYERSGGFAGVMEKFTLYADGRIERADGSVVAVQASQVLGLLRDIEALGFFDLQDSYGKFSACRDCFTHSVTVITSDRSKTVTATDGSETPEEFWNVVTKITALLPPADE